MSVSADSTVCLNDGQGNLLVYSADLQSLKWQRSIPSSVYLNPPLCKEGTMVLTQAGFTLIGLQFVQPLAPVADFRCSSRRIGAGQPLDFFDQSSFLPTGWQWQFPGSVQGNAAVQHPTGIVYTAPGIFPVSLTVQNAQGSDSITKTCYLEVMNTTGLTEAGMTTLQVFPNPAHQFIRMNTGRAMTNTGVEILDMKGSTVLTAVIRDEQQEIDISTLPVGAYLLRLTSYGVPTVRFIRQ
jgi:PKD repeat protein